MPLNSRGHQAERHAFTLIEVLVVVIIIAILASIAMPRFASSPDKVRAAEAKSELRNLVTIQEAYFADSTRYLSALPRDYRINPNVSVEIDAVSRRGWRATAVAINGTVCHIAVGDQVRSGEGDGDPSCNTTPTLVGVRPLNALDSVVAALPLSDVAFDAPTEMILRRPTTIVVVLDPRRVPAAPRAVRKLDPASTDSLVATLLLAGSSDSMPHEAAVIHYSPRMRAELRGQSFTITPRTPEEQGVGAREPTIWRWEVTPTEVEDHVLALTISALVSVHKHEVLKAYPVLDRHIRVHANVLYYAETLLAEHWEWIVGSLLLPFLIWRWKSRKPAEHRARARKARD